MDQGAWAWSLSYPALHSTGTQRTSPSIQIVAPEQSHTCFRVLSVNRNRRPLEALPKLFSASIVSLVLRSLLVYCVLCISNNSLRRAARFNSCRRTALEAQFTLSSSFPTSALRRVGFSHKSNLGSAPSSWCIQNVGCGGCCASHSIPGL